MKKEVIGIVVAIIIVAVIIVGVVVYRRSRTVDLSDEQALEELQIEKIDMGNSLVAMAETLEEAENIADLYGITLVSYENKVAVYTTDKELQELIRLGEEKGYPAIGINNSHTIK